ncbi:MAG: MBL fold metallo-hydrolase [Cytophagales bacterium]|nr:MBL fold metallo-hydrolase [Cytophagales bacterium]
MKTISLAFKGADGSISVFFFPEHGILIETGPYITFPDIEKGLIREGYKSEDVKHVFLTHTHLDHAGAAWAWAERNAKIYVHAKGAASLQDLSIQQDLIRQFFVDQNLPVQETISNVFGEVRPIDKKQIVELADQQEFRFGTDTFRVHHTPGHTQDHICWQFEDKFFTGDIGGASIAGVPLFTPFPPLPDLDIPAWKKSLDKLEALIPGSLCVAHYGEVSRPIDHLQDFRSQFDLIEKWVETRYEDHANLQTLVPIFEDFLKGFLKDRGLSAEEAERYTASNPPWLSVYGFASYLRG